MLCDIGESILRSSMLLHSQTTDRQTANSLPEASSFAASALDYGSCLAD